MGYLLNELASLPLDEEINLYIFVINGKYKEPLYDTIKSNIFEIAKNIGRNAVVAFGTDAQSFTTQVATKYLGKGNSDPDFTSILPALLITTAHPEQLTKDSLRLIVPLKEAESRFGSWAYFFDLLGRYARGESDEFKAKFENQETLLQATNKIIGLKPGMFGISININELIDRAIK